MCSVLWLSDGNGWTKTQPLSQVIKELLKKGEAESVQILQFLRDQRLLSPSIQKEEHSNWWARMFLFKFHPTWLERLEIAGEPISSLQCISREREINLFRRSKSYLWTYLIRWSIKIYKAPNSLASNKLWLQGEILKKLILLWLQRIHLAWHSASGAWGRRQQGALL